MVVSWPSDLPLKVDPHAFSLAMPDGWLKSQTSTGPGKMRRVSTAAPVPITASMALSVNQEARFWRFYEDEIGGGVLPFMMIDPRWHGYDLLDTDGNSITCTGGNSMLIDGNVVPETDGGDVITIAAYCWVRLSSPPQKSGFGPGRYSLQMNLLR